MWGTVMVVALIAAFDPVRLGIALLLISRPRPLLNLFAYWAGAMVASVTAALGLLMVLRAVAPILTDHVTAVAASPAARHVQIGLGVVALAVAVLIAVGFSVRQRTPAEVTGTSTLTLMEQPTPRVVDRLSTRRRNALEDRFSWVAFGAGVISATPPVEYLVIIAVILSSGAATGAQVGAALIFTVVSLAAIEIPLLSSLAQPVRTRAVMTRLHDWTHARRRTILSLGIAVVGIFMLTSGMR